MANLVQIPSLPKTIQISNCSHEAIIKQVLTVLPQLIGHRHPINTEYKIVPNPNIQRYSFSNFLFHIIAENDEIGDDEKNTNNHNKKQYLLRIYGTSAILVKRENEIFFAKLLDSKGVGPQIYATFNNGRIEEFYANSVVLDPLCQFTEHSKYHNISRELATFHSIKIENNNTLEIDTFWTRIKKWHQIASNFTLNDYKNNAHRYKVYQEIGWNENDYMSSLTKWIKNIAPIYEKRGIQNGQNNAIKVMKVLYGKNINIDNSQNIYLEYIARSFLNEIILSHNDVYVGNILQCEDGKIKLIDFEYASYNFRGFDFGKLIGHSLCPRRYFKDENDIMAYDERTKYIHGYLMQFVNDKRYKFGEIFNDKKKWDLLIESFDFVIIEFVIICTYYWGIWAVLQSVLAGDKEIKIEYIEYGYHRLHTQIKCFRKLWDELYNKKIQSVVHSRSLL